MKHVAVANTTRGSQLASRAGLTTSALERMRGLLGTASLAEGEGLVLDPCASVHMFGMRYALDVIFADQDQTVREVVRDLRPWRMTGWVRGARYAIELPTGAAADTRLGDQLEIREIQ